jgi:hypothetical protein
VDPHQTSRFHGAGKQIQREAGSSSSSSFMSSTRNFCCRGWSARGACSTSSL